MNRAEKSCENCINKDRCYEDRFCTNNEYMNFEESEVSKHPRDIVNCKEEEEERICDTCIHNESKISDTCLFCNKKDRWEESELSICKRKLKRAVDTLENIIDNFEMADDEKVITQLRRTRDLLVV